VFFIDANVQPPPLPPYAHGAGSTAPTWPTLVHVGDAPGDGPVAFGTSLRCPYQACTDPDFR
jgi:hypothetical protein